jgi:hypothetical protein
MHLAGRQTGRTVLLTGRVFGGGVRTRGLDGFDLGLELGELGGEGRELGGEGGVLGEELGVLVLELGVLVLELGVLVLELGVLGDEGEDLHGWWRELDFVPKSVLRLDIPTIYEIPTCSIIRCRTLKVLHLRSNINIVIGVENL